MLTNGFWPLGDVAAFCLAVYLAERCACLYEVMWKWSVCSFRTYSLQNGLMRKGGSHEQEHTGTQT